jgi:hypothetical protein
LTGGARFERAFAGQTDDDQHLAQLRSGARFQRSCELFHCVSVLQIAGVCHFDSFHELNAP